MWELGIYRINKKIPRNLPFEERKRLFVNSPEFKSQIHQRNHHKTESELTEENIQQEIDSAGTMAGIALDKQFDSVRDQKAFAEGFCELIIDKGDVQIINHTSLHSTTHPIRPVFYILRQLRFIIIGLCVPFKQIFI